MSIATTGAIWMWLFLYSKVMTTEQILQNDRVRLRQVNNAIASLKNDKREKSQNLLHKFEELREILKISIESNETALKLENEFNGMYGSKIVFVM